MRSNNGKQQTQGRFALRTSVTAVVVALGTINAAQAMEINSGNPDIELRWDNTVRYNIGVRANHPSKIGNNPNYDEGDYKFSETGDVVTNRLDLLSEFDFVYQKKYGFRVSGAAWYDNAYRDTKAKRNPRILNRGNPAGFVNPIQGAFVPVGSPIPGSYFNDDYTDWTEKYYKQGGELLDSFVFGTFDVGGMPLSVKAGRHTQFWGETLLLGGALHGVSYAQMPIDLAKGFATPGVEAKELFRPLNSLSGKLQVTNDLSLAAQYFFDWEAYRFPEGGTFLGPIDLTFNGPQRVASSLGVVPQGRIATPDKQGDIALSARWSPEALDGTLGFYYRNYTDKLLGLMVAGGAPRSTQNPAGLQYQQFYGEDIDLYGISLSKQIAGVSVGAELSYRKNTPLTGQFLGTTPSALNGMATSGNGLLGLASGILRPLLYPTSGPAAITLKDNSYQARGNTIHLVLNAVGIVPATPFFDTASYVVEGVYSRLDKVTDNKDMYFGEGYGVCNNNGLKNYVATAFGGLNPVVQTFIRAQAKDKWDGCATREYYGLAVNFTPTWFQVMPGVDLSAPLSWSRGMKGNSALAFAGNEENGQYALGLAADAYQKYRFDIKYVDYFGATKNGNLNGLPATISQNGFSTLLKDRGHIVATFKTTF
jgi:hypothetical protein